MPHELRFLTMVPPNLPWPELLKRYQYLERLGFDLAAFADHFVDWTGAKGPWFECWTLLTAIAAHTSRIKTRHVGDADPAAQSRPARAPGAHC